MKYSGKMIAVLALVCGAVSADDIDFSHITIVDNATAFNASFDVSNIPTNSAALPATDGFGYASQGQAADTFVDFMFDQPYIFSNVTYVDRLHSGADDTTIGGILDFVTDYDIILSENATFGDGDDTVVSVGPLTAPAAPSGLADFLSNATIPDVTAQYIRWDVTGTPGANPGAHAFAFDGVVPEPSTLLGLVAGLAAICAWRRRGR
jgi:hypothetical protein